MLELTTAGQPARGKASTGLSTAEAALGDLVAADAFALEVVDLAQERNDPRAMAEALYARAGAATKAGDVAAAQR